MLDEKQKQALKEELDPSKLKNTDGLWPGSEVERPDYEAFGTCLEIQSLKNKEILICGPAGTGKTRSVLELVHRLMETYPGARALLVRKTRESLSESVLQIFEQWVLGPDHPLVIDGPRRDNRKIYEYFNGSEILCGGMDKPGRVMSTEYDVIATFESIELAEDDWEHLTTRIRNYVIPNQRIIADTNPSHPRHWLKLRTEDNGPTKLLSSHHTDNPRLWNEELQKWTKKGTEYVEGILGNLTGVRRSRLLEGKWVKAEGLIYDFDPEIHMLDKFEIPNAWQKYRAIDFGWRHAFCCLWAAEDEDGRLYIYRQLYMSQRTVKSHAEQIIEYSNRDRMMEPKIICDHQASDQATLRECGLETINANKAVEIGLDVVRERLKVQGDGKPRLFILRDSLIEVDQNLKQAKKPYRLETEFDSYTWKSSDFKEEPTKVDDHALDALRYLCMQIDHGEREPEFEILSIFIPRM